MLLPERFDGKSGSSHFNPADSASAPDADRKEGVSMQRSERWLRRLSPDQLQRIESVAKNFGRVGGCFLFRTGGAVESPRKGTQDHRNSI